MAENDFSKDYDKSYPKEGANRVKMAGVDDKLVKYSVSGSKGTLATKKHPVQDLKEGLDVVKGLKERDPTWEYHLHGD